MKVVIRSGNLAIPATIASNGESVSIASCPNCCAAPASVRGTGISHRDHDTYYAAARALCCGEVIGVMETRVSTIFGIKEDEAVLCGRPRVY